MNRLAHMDSWYPSQTLVEACLKKDFMSSRCSRRIAFSTQEASLSKRRSLPNTSNRMILISSQRNRVYRYEGGAQKSQECRDATRLESRSADAT